ncbi:MAG: ATP-binding cassette domain-containing protein [Peptococcaceae bacterium]|nr:ATP-binding cassette domain-containing protein [Candidatus Syntrophopropionicum ammoniitolerans]
MLDKITILGGRDKGGRREKISRLEIAAGDVLAVVGPTGSGKTQLISDIEQYDEKETLTGRSVLIANQLVGRNENKKSRRYLVAQVSQNMNFVIDMSVAEFLLMHARVRGIEDPERIIEKVLAITNHLSGEPVAFSTNLTQLSGGQSRALMVADVAIISNAPVVLIDEIENAGIDRLQALEILRGQGKIVLVVSHDPTLMLMAGKRVIMKNGGMEKICCTTAKEKRILADLVKIEKRVAGLREQLRRGDSIGHGDNNVEDREREVGLYGQGVSAPAPEYQQGD